MHVPGFVFIFFEVMKNFALKSTAKLKKTQQNTKSVFTRRHVIRSSFTATF